MGPSFVQRWARLLVQLYPRSFRVRNGADLERLLQDCGKDAASVNQARFLAFLIQNTLASLRGALAEWARSIGHTLRALLFIDLLRAARALRRQPAFSAAGRQRKSSDGRRFRQDSSPSGGLRIALITRELGRAFRSLGREPGAAFIAVLVLALGIGLSAFIYNFVYGVYLRGWELPGADRLYVITETKVEENQFDRPVPIQHFVQWRARQTHFEGLVAHQSGTTIDVSGPDLPIGLQGSFVTANALTLLGVEPAIGRGFLEGDDTPGAPPLLILSYPTWRELFRSDPGVIGMDVRVHGEPGTIIGVMPEGFDWPGKTEVWLPLQIDPLTSEQGRTTVGVWGRLRDGVSPEVAATGMQEIARQLAQEHPEEHEGVGIHLYSSIEVGRYDDGQLNNLFAAIIAAVVCVLLVACVNVGSLLLARATMRTHEAGVRTALGASRWQVSLPFAAEALALSAAGAVLGLGVAAVTTSWFAEATATARPSYIRIEMEWLTFGFVVGLTTITALLASVAPALHLLRTDVNLVLKDESRGSSGRRGGRLTRILVTAQVAISSALLVGAALMAGSMAKLARTDHPFETERVLTAHLNLNTSGYPDPDARRVFWQDLHSEINALPSVESASFASQIPYGQGSVGPTSMSVSIDGVDYGDSERRPRVNVVAVAPGFFETYGVEISLGRAFRDNDDGDFDRVAIVNQPMVDRYFGGGNPIGRQFREGLADTLPPLRVVGVVPDLHVQSPLLSEFDGYEPAAYYVPLLQTDRRVVTLVARARGSDFSALAGDLRRAVSRVDQNLPLYSMLGQREVIAQTTAGIRTFGTLFIAFGIASMFMASVGLYGVLAFGVARRTSEMGIRMALGAGTANVVRLVLGQGLRQVGLGLGIGIPAAFAVAPLLGLIVYEVEPRDPLVFLAVTLMVLGVGLLASFMPARRATRVDPINALRSE